MKFSLRFLYASVAGVFLLTSCAKEETGSYDKYETIALKAWMKLNRPELLENYQQEGGYYVDVKNPGEEGAAPITDTVCWVRFDFSGRDLKGNIVLTRREQEARQMGTFTKYTHYAPYYRYCGTESLSLLEGTHLAMRNTLTLGERYADSLGLPQELLLREGSEVVLYMPSTVVGSGGVQGDGGYEGQYSLSSGRPMIVTMHILDTVKNPLESEGSEVDEFCKQDGGLRIYVAPKPDVPDFGDQNLRPGEVNDKHPYKIPEQWVNVCDTVPQLYADFRYTPERKLSFPLEKRYRSIYEPYAAFDQLEEDISKALVERFHKDDPYKGVLKLESDSVTLDGKAKIWYIARLLDGFIVDTNIDEVKKLIYGEVLKKGSAFSYTPSSGGAVTAWYYTVPHLKYGQWAAIMTTSVYAYGASGVVGGSSSGGGSNSYLDYYNYYNYYNSYYGNNGYYGGYYGDYYGGYYGGYYNGYGSGYDDSYDQEETTTVSTEIPPYTPMIFQLFVEPEDED